VGHACRVRRFPGALCALALLIASAQGEADRWYVVREGDTLTRIAVRHGVTVGDLATQNGLDPRDVIRIGQRLRVPGEAPAQPSPEKSQSPLPEVIRPAPSEPAVVPTRAGPESHVVEQGETLYALAKRYGVPLPDLMAWNGMRPKDVLRIGQRLNVRPPQTAVPAPPPSVPATPAPEPRPEPAAPPPPKPEASPKPEAKAEGKPEAKTETKAAPEGEKRPTIEPKPDAEPKPQPAPEGAAPRAESDAARSRESAERPRPISVSSKHSPSGFHLRFFSRRKPEAEGVYLRGCKEAIDRPKIKRDRWRYIVIHHSGTSKGSADVFEHYHRMVRGMENGLAYQFVIGNGSYTGDGQIEVGDRWLRQKAGGHLYSEFLNEISIGICFVGNFNEERPTARQIAACIELVDYLRKICPGARPKFVLHREINPRPTECPGKLFPGDALRKRLK